MSSIECLSIQERLRRLKEKRKCSKKDSKKQKVIREITELCSKRNVQGIENVTSVINSDKNRKFWHGFVVSMGEDPLTTELLEKFNTEAEALLKSVPGEHPLRTALVKSTSLLNKGFLTWGSIEDSSSDED